MQKMADQAAILIEPQPTKTKWALDGSKVLFESELVMLRHACAKRAKKGKVGFKDAFTVALLLETGLRVQEAADLKIGDIYVDHLCLIVRNGKCKKGKPEPVHFSKRFQKRLREFLVWKVANNEGIKPEDPLIRSNYTGGHINKRTVQRAFERCVALAKILKHSSHHCRHTFGSRLFKVTKNLRLVQLQLRHTKITTTQDYITIFDDELHHGLEKMY